MEIWLVVIIYVIAWGFYHFWGYDMMMNKVLTNPEKYPAYKVTFYKRLTLLPKALISFLTALLVPFIVIGIIIAVSYVRILFK